MRFRRPSFRDLVSGSPSYQSHPDRERQSLSRGPLRATLLLASAAALVAGVMIAAPAQAAAPASAPIGAVPAAGVAAATTPLAPTSTTTKPTVKYDHTCGAPIPGYASCFALHRTDVKQPAGMKQAAVSPNATPSGITPANLQSAYKLTGPTGGSGQTVGIVDAYNDPNAASDLASYRTQFGLPACTVASGCFRQVSQTGSTTSLPINDTGWAGEISLDVDMVSAVCPNCKILLVEATTPDDANLYAAEDEAVALGAKFVSNSWGGPESNTQTSDDAHFNHPGVAITVSSGDDGTGAQYPATSRFVTAVGGTHLTTSSNARGWTESAWSDAGSGCSAFDAKATWQTVTTNCAKRAEADVSAVADPATGVAVFQTFGGTGWAVYGGTSASSPIIASTYALAGTPPATSSPASFPYAHASSLFDVTSGSNGSCGAPICTSGTGWDGPTGLGTPNGVAAFTSGTTTGGNTVTVTNPGSQTATVGTAFSLQLGASDSASGQSLTYTASGLPAGLSISSAGLISGTPTAGGTFTVTATATDSTGASGSASFTLTVSGGTGGGGGTCAGAQLLGNPGFESGTTPWSATTGVIGGANGGEVAHTGSRFAYLGGYASTHTDTLSQSVTIPAGCTGTTLSFFLHIDTDETTTTTAFDKLTVKVGSTTLASFSNLNKNTGYAQKSFPVGSFAGQTVTLTFTGTTDTSKQTSFLVDDTAVTTS